MMEKRAEIRQLIWIYIMYQTEFLTALYFMVIQSLPVE